MDIPPSKKICTEQPDSETSFPSKPVYIMEKIVYRRWNPYTGYDTHLLPLVLKEYQENQNK
jgi:hypothetical protein